MSQDLLGTEIGGYTLLQQIGEGGNGVVYRAVHTKNKQAVAIKILLDLKSPSSANRFFEEARAIRQINHPNIVEIVELQTLPDGRPYLVMELLQGENLEKYLKLRKRLHAVESLEICIPVAEALAAAHEKGIIHRDLKPDNIFLVAASESTKKRVKLLDFGIAKLHGPEGVRRITQSGMLLGTPHYMSPEQANQPKNVDGRTDLYALGVILYEMVTGKLPFDSETPIAVLFLHFDRAPTPPSKHVPGLSTKLESLILRCLSKTPNGRPASARAFVAECKEILSFERIEALKRTKAAPPLNEKSLKGLNALLPPRSRDFEEDEATSVGPAPEELDEILELDDALELVENPEPTPDVKAILGRIMPGLDPNKTTEDGILAFSREADSALTRGTQELTQPKTNQDLAKLVVRRAEQKAAEIKPKFPTPSPEKPSPSRIAPRISTFKPNTEAAPKAKTPSPQIETKVSIPRSNNTPIKPQKSQEPAEEDVVTAQKNVGPKTIQTFAPSEEPSSPRTLLMTPAEEAIRLRLKIFPADAKIVFWINDSVHTPESTPTEIFAAKKAIVEIAVVARGFLPKQVTVLVTKDADVVVSLERPGPRAPIATKPAAPPDSKR
jgi:serine/threonine protein kinase